MFNDTFCFVVCARAWKENTIASKPSSFQREAEMDVRVLRLINHDVRLDLLNGLPVDNDALVELRDGVHLLHPPSSELLDPQPDA